MPGMCIENPMLWCRKKRQQKMFQNPFNLYRLFKGKPLHTTLATGFKRVQNIVSGFVARIGHGVQFFLGCVFLNQKISHNPCCQKRRGNTYRPFIFHANKPFLINKQKLFRVIMLTCYKNAKALVYVKNVSKRFCNLQHEKRKSRLLKYSIKTATALFCFFETVNKMPPSNRRAAKEIFLYKSIVFIIFALPILLISANMCCCLFPRQFTL